MRIGELARELGVTAHAVRFYEKAGWLPQPGRAENGYREYDIADLDHLRLLVDLRRLDLPLDSAARLASVVPFRPLRADLGGAAAAALRAARRHRERIAGAAGLLGGCGYVSLAGAPRQRPAAIRRQAHHAGSRSRVPAVRQLQPCGCHRQVRMLLNRPQPRGGSSTTCASRMPGTLRS